MLTSKIEDIHPRNDKTTSSVKDTEQASDSVILPKCSGTLIWLKIRGKSERCS